VTALSVVASVVFVAAQPVATSVVSAAGSTTGTVAGRVYQDYNSNGAYDTTAGTGLAVDVGIQSVTVRAFDADGDLVGTATTAADGTYTINVTGAKSTAIRVEFDTPSGYSPSFVGSGNGSSVQFVTMNATNINYGVNVPGDYCQNNPDLAITCFRNGYVTAGGDSMAATDAVKLFNSTASGTAPTVYQGASKLEVGAVYGQAYNNSGTTKYLYSAAYIKRHVGLGSGGAGAIYRTDVTTISTPGAPSLFATIPNVGFAFTSTDRGLSTNPATPSYDTQGYAAAGKAGLGDMDISEDGSTLYVMNLNDKKIYMVDTATGTVSGTTLTVPTPTCTNGNWRPYALEIYRGVLYAGGVCDAATGTTQNLTMQIYPYDLTAGTWGSGLFSTMPKFDYDATAGNNDRQCAYISTGNGSHGCLWNPWTDTWTGVDTWNYSGNIYFAYRPAPILSDIDFVNSGAMVISIRDRFADQSGFQNYQLSGTNLYMGTQSGDVLRATGSAGVWTLESGNAPTEANEYFHDEYFSWNSGGSQHPETGSGSSALQPGTNVVASAVMDPLNIWSGGVDWFSTATARAAASQEVQLYVDGSTTTFPATSTGTFGKANGLGDLEILCDRAPLQIGNRIWRDLDQDGIQDADETGIAGVTVHLYAADGTTLLGTAVTNATGNYYFSSNNTEAAAGEDASPDEFGGGLPVGSAVVIRADNASDFAPAGLLGNFSLSPANVAVPNTTLDDSVDNDATIVSSYPQISVAAHAAGVNDHTLDIGFYPLGSLGFSKTSSAAGGPLKPGDALAYTLMVNNSSGATISNVAVTDPLPSGLTHASTVVTAPTTSATYFDDFDEAGSWLGDPYTTTLAAWSANSWTETDAGGAGTATGRIKKVKRGAGLTSRFRAGATNTDMITRVVGDLTGRTSVTLTFAYGCNDVEAGKNVAIWVRPDASAAWGTAVSTIPSCNGGTGTTFTTVGPVAVTAGLWGTATEIRIGVSTGTALAGNDYVSVDDVTLTATGGRATATVLGAAPPNLVTLTDLAAGESATVVVNTTVNNPFTPTFGEVFNTATVSSGSNYAADSTIDCVKCYDYGDDPSSYNGAGGLDPGRAWQNSLRNTIADTFASLAYTGSTGTLAWGGNWTETDSAVGGAGAGAGFVQVVTVGGSQLARIGTTSATAAPVGTQLLRSLGNLSGAGYTSASVNVTYRCSAMGADDTVVMESSADGVTWSSALMTITNCNNGQYASNQIVTLPSIGTNTQIRFRVTSAMEQNEFFYIDSVEATLVADTTFTGPRLGSAVDREASLNTGGAPNAVTSPAAPTGDDNASTDDEDGVALPNVNGPTMVIPITVSNFSSGSASVNGWFDWNRNGAFDSGESIFNSAYFLLADAGLTVSGGVGTVTAPGTYNVTILVPDVTGTYSTNEIVYSRFRVASLSAGVAAATGASADGEVEDHATTLTTLPVNLAYVGAKRLGGVVTVDWRTAQEVDNLGFNIYAQRADGTKVKVNQRIILAKAPTSMSSQRYRTTVLTDADTIWLEDVAINGATEMHGPFKVGTKMGDVNPPAPIDWAASKQQVNSVLASQQLAQRAAVLRTTKAAAKSPTFAGPVAQLAVTTAGVQVITYEQLRAAGIDLKGVKAANLAVTDGRGPVQIEVLGSSTFGRGSSIRFLGQPLDTLYTGTNVYWLHVDKSLARRIAKSSARPSRTTVTGQYTATALVNNNTTYSMSAPGTDPWYDQDIVSFPWYQGSAQTTVNLLSPLPGQTATVEVELWGNIYSSVPDEHHVQLVLNGVVIGEGTFDDLQMKRITATISSSDLLNGANQLQVVDLADTGVEFDIVSVNTWKITYPRALSAIDGRLDFVAGGNRVEITNVPTKNTLVYRVASNGAVTKLATTALKTGVAVKGSGGVARYVVAAPNAVRTPSVIPMRPTVQLIGGHVDYLIVTHSSLVSSLAPLVSYHQGLGRTVKVVDVADIYQKYSHGITDAAAINAFLDAALPAMGVKWLLVAGSDTNDYRDYMGLGSYSLVPSVYGRTGPTITFAPLDPAYADWNNDGVPDVAMGRMPARTPAELVTMIDKTTAYQPTRTAVLASDANDGLDYAAVNDELAATLDGWSVLRADPDRPTASAARSTLLQALQDRQGLAIYLGHSSSTEWSTVGLFAVGDIASLSAENNSTVVAQFGCFNTYYASPMSETLAHQWMLAPGGAAAVMGAVTLTSTAADVNLARLLTAQLATGDHTIGEAVLAAKQALRNQVGSTVVDIEMGWTILGDPALPVGASA